MNKLLENHLFVLIWRMEYLDIIGLFVTKFNQKKLK